MGGYRTPLVEDIPIPKALESADLRVQPATPPQPVPRGAGYAGKGGQAANLASRALTGWVQGLSMAEARRAQQVNREMDVAKQLYDRSKTDFSEFAQREDVRAAAQKYAQWLQANTMTGPGGEKVPGVFLRGQQSPITPQEQELLDQLGQRKLQAEENKNRYADTLAKYVIPEEGQPRGKGKEKGGVREMPIIGHLMQMFMPNIEPQMIPGTLVEAIRKEEIRAPEPSAEERFQQARLKEFEEGAPVRAKEREGTAARLDVEAQVRTKQSELAEAVRKGDRESEDRIFREIQALKGERVSAAEQLGEETAKIGLSVLEKTKQGLSPQANPDKFTDAEKAWHQRTLQYRPDSVERAILDKVGTTVNGKVYTLDNAIDEIVRMQQRITSATRPPSAFQQQLEFYREAEAFSQFQKPYTKIGPNERGIVDMAVATRLKATPGEREAAKTTDPFEIEKRASAAMLAAANEDRDRFQRFIKAEVSQPKMGAAGKVSGEVVYRYNPKPGGYWWSFGEGERTELAAEGQEFLRRAAEKMRQYGLTEEQIRGYLGQSQTHSPTVGPPPVPQAGAANTVKYRTSDGRLANVPAHQEAEFLKRDPGAKKLQ